MQTLSNDILSVTIAERGAEMQSIRDAQGHEYLWQADPKYWAKHSPPSSPSSVDSGTTPIISTARSITCFAMDLPARATSLS